MKSVLRTVSEKSRANRAHKQLKALVKKLFEKVTCYRIFSIHAGTRSLEEGQTVPRNESMLETEQSQAEEEVYKGFSA